MKCREYSTLGNYYNIMMPVKKSEFDKQVVVTESYEKKCDNTQQEMCDKIAKKCVIGVNDRAVCEVGAPHEYQKNMLKL